MDNKELENEIIKIKVRNKKVELDKSWETSWARRICICILTYIVVVIYSIMIKNITNIWLSSLVPVIGFTLSTLSLKLVRNIWEKNAIDKSTKVKNKVLITGAVLSSDNSSVDTYESIISLIDTSKYAVSSPLDTMKFKGNDVERYERAMNLLKDTKMIIAEMSSVSTGQGMELQEAVNLGIPILVVAKEGSKISGLVKGCKNVKDIIYYKEINDIKDKILKFIEEEK